MGNAIKSAIVRLCKVSVAGGIMGGLYCGLQFLQTTPIGIFVIPVGTAILNAVGKAIKVKTGIKMPF